MLPNTHVLSDVHTACQYQVIPESVHAVTRFKIHFPCLKDHSEIQHRKPNSNANSKKQDAADIDTKPESYVGSTAGKKTEKGKHSSETKHLFDEDGDLVLDRNPCKSDEFREVTSRKKKKLDVTDVTTKVVEVSQNELENEFDCCDREHESSVKLDEDSSAVNQDSQLPMVKHDTCQCRSRNNESPQHFVSDCKEESSFISSDKSVSSNMKDCDICVSKMPPDKGEQNQVNLPDISQGTSAVAAIGTSDFSSQEKKDVMGATGLTDHKNNDYKESTDVSESSNVGDEAENDTPDDRPDIYFINIKHSLATYLDDVGEQVWHGALLLSDYIISDHGNFENRTIVDLGAGVGLSSIVAAMYANMVFCTDTGEKVLSLAEDNILAATTCPTLPRTLCDVHVRQLDWFRGLEEDVCKHGLTKDNISRICNCHILIAADVIYDFDITDAFFNVVRKIMIHPPRKTLYIGLEKRIVFTVEDFTATSPGYNYFRLHLEDLCSGEENDTEVAFEVEQLDTSFPQYFQYNRIKQLELWKITAKLRS